MSSEPYISPLLAGGSITLVFSVLFTMIIADLVRGGRIQSFLEERTQALTFAIAFTATAASLYYSEVVGFIPCEFCWFQRIMMYPLALLLLVAIVTRSRIDSRYIAVLASVGLLVSIYHYQLQLFPEQAQVCNGVVACTDKNVEAFGFATIPFMAGAGFLSILLLQVAEWRIDLLYRRGALTA